MKTKDVDLQRREPRKLRAHQVAVNSLPHLEVSISGQLRNISAHGLGLVLRVPIRAGSFVAVEWADRVALGNIVYCTEGDDGSDYQVGIRIDYLIIDRTTPAQSDHG